MKTSYIFGITLVFIVLVFALAVTANIDRPMASAKSLNAASLSMQIATPTALAGDHSEVGSTDGIVIMGVVLVFIVTVPLLYHRKKK